MKHTIIKLRTRRNRKVGYKNQGVKIYSFPTRQEQTKMTGIIYKVEVGVLLTKDHPEFSSYNHVFTNEFGFYDENVSVFSSYAKAKEEAVNYINSGVNMTYAIITSDYYKTSETDERFVAELLSGERCLDSSWNFGYTEEDILYFAYKEDGKIIILRHIENHTGG